MGIVNRTLDATEQKQVFEETIVLTATATAYPLLTVPHPMNMTDAKCVAYGLSGAPTGALQVNRFVVGAGATTIAIGGALTHVAYGTSGMQTFSLPALGSTLLALQKGDVIQLLTAGTNAGLLNAQVSLVCQSTQSIKSWF